MTPFAKALLACHQGDRNARFVISRDDGFAQPVPVSVFYEDGTFPGLETRALSLCRGRVLDVGACAGRHSLALRKLGHEVTSLEVEPECEGILRSRGLKDVVIADIMNWTGRRFDTVLMLMNGIGMVGNPDGLDRFLARLPVLLQPGGCLLCDSVDVTLTNDPVHAAYREANGTAGRSPGQQSFRIIFGNETGKPFEWLHIAPDLLTGHCAKAGLSSEIVYREPGGHYLARILPRPAIPRATVSP